MPSFFKNRTNILVVVFLIVIAALGWLWYSYYGFQEPETGIRSVSGETGEQSMDQEFLRLLESLEALKIDRSVFQEPVFQSLIDLLPAIETPTAKGRTNPFRPL